MLRYIWVLDQSYAYLKCESGVYRLIHSYRFKFFTMTWRRLPYTNQRTLVDACRMAWAWQWQKGAPPCRHAQCARVALLMRLESDVGYTWDVVLCTHWRLDEPRGARHWQATGRHYRDCAPAWWRDGRKDRGQIAVKSSTSSVYFLIIKISKKRFSLSISAILISRVYFSTHLKDTS